MEKVDAASPAVLSGAFVFFVRAFAEKNRPEVMVPADWPGPVKTFRKGKIDGEALEARGGRMTPRLSSCGAVGLPPVTSMPQSRKEA